MFHAANIIIWVAHIIIWAKMYSITSVESAVGLLSLCGIIVNATGLIVAILGADLAYKERHSHSQGP